jgi:hypothetical protein
MLMRSGLAVFAGGATLAGCGPLVNIAEFSRLAHSMIIGIALAAILRAVFSAIRD